VVVVALQLARCVAAETAVAGPLRARGASSMPVSQSRDGITAVGVAEWLGEPLSVCDGRSVQHIRSKGQIAELGAFIAKPLEKLPDRHDTQMPTGATIKMAERRAACRSRVPMWRREGELSFRGGRRARKSFVSGNGTENEAIAGQRRHLASADAGCLSAGGDHEIHLSNRMMPICAGFECAETSLREWISARWAA